MRVVPLLVIIAWFSRGQARTLLASGSGNRKYEKCLWLKLMWLRLPPELTVNTEALFEVVHIDGRTFDASEIQNCTVREASASSGGVLENEQAVRLTRTMYNTLQIIMSRELERIRGDARVYWLLSLVCGESQFCIQFPGGAEINLEQEGGRINIYEQQVEKGTSGRAAPQYLSRKFLSVESEQNSVDDYQHHAMIALVGVAGVIILIIAGAICVCGGEEITPPPAKLLSLSQTSLGGSRQESFGEDPPNRQTLMGSAVDNKGAGNEKREEITKKRQESRVGARSDDAGKQSNRAAENDVRTDLNCHSTDPAEHVGTHSRHSAEVGEEQKERKSRKSKLSFLGKNKRSTLEGKESSQGQTDYAQPSASVADRPRVPTPQPTEHHPRELPHPPSLGSTGLNPPHEQRLSAPGGWIEDCDQYEVVVHADKKRSASATAAEDSYETVKLRVLVGEEFGKVRPVSTDSTCTYDTVGEGQASRRESELYEVVDMEVRANALAGEDNAENDTYELVIRDAEAAGTGNHCLSSADTYEEVILRQSAAADTKFATVRQDLKEGEAEKNETDEFDPKYSKVRQRLNGKAENIECDEVDPKYSKVRQRLNGNGNGKAENIETDEVDPKYSKIRHCVNAKEGQAKNDSAEVVVGNVDSAAAAVDPDQRYAEVTKDLGQEARSQGSALAERPRLLEHSSAPELVGSDGYTKSFDSLFSDAPPAPSLNHLKEVAEAARPRASSEVRHSQKRPRRVTEGHVEDVTIHRPFSADHCADEEVTQIFNYPYARVDLTQTTRLSQGTEERSHDESDEDTDASEEDPPPLPPIYVSLPKNVEKEEEEEEGSSEERRTTPVEQQVEAPSDGGIYDEINPSSSSSVVIKAGDVPQSTRVVSTCSVDSDYETVEELLKYVPNADATSNGRRGDDQSNTKQSEVSSGYETVRPMQVTANTEVNRFPSANVQETLPDGEPHYEPVHGASQR